MITLENVSKRYMTKHGAGPWVLKDVNLQIPNRVSVGLVGRNGAGKSTLMRLIGGTDEPTRGRIVRDVRVSFPLGLGGGLQASLTGRQNAMFVCRMYGLDDDRLEGVLDGIAEYAELGKYFDEPVSVYSSGMGARLRFAISLAFDFEMYLVDEVTAVGDILFKKKSKETFRQLADHAGLIMVSHDDKSLKEFCTAGIWLHEGRAYWFDDINEAVAKYRKSLSV